MSSSKLTLPLMARQPTSCRASAPVDNHEVEVWVRGVNGIRYPVKMPISSKFADVMQKVSEQRFFQGVFVGFEGGREVGGWSERTTVSQILPVSRPPKFNEEEYLYEHPIQPKFKVRRV
ncbi:unnamed protein product [Phytophthora fragariaefolia]|uniref:Unnamed protein product n=1 Tax=Phytophthora fragariaefolia TaxID=1490495 RepID=A0A9W6XWC6_9STRA|nr:unnamed protein product [Phytophthora fragariaefolia]